jgi:Cu-Zn family superoxide dismutase
VALLGIVALTAPVFGDEHARAEGPSIVYSPGPANPLTGTEGEVRAVTTGDGKTIVRLRLEGFAESVEGRTFGAHVHRGACGGAPADSLGHYQNPAAPAGTLLRDKEIWLDFTVKDEEGRSKAKVGWVIQPGDARSVVIHAQPTNPDTGAAGTRLACFNVDF